MKRSHNALGIAVVSGLLAVKTLWIGFGLWFAPGWANGWPGLPQNVVWPIGLAVIVTVVVLAMTAGGGAVVCEAAGGDARVLPPTGWFRGWLIASLMITAAFAWAAHSIFRDQALVLWP